MRFKENLKEHRESMTTIFGEDVVHELELCQPDSRPVLVNLTMLLAIVWVIVLVGILLLSK
jgi:hypothetical protein